MELSAATTTRQEEGKEGSELEGVLRAEQRRALPPSSQQPWEGGGTPALSSWEERLYEAASAWPSALWAPGDAEEGRSAGRPIGRAAEPVCVQTSRDH